eukprot:TRINITY_DN70100_c0_g1_i1.p2 TRINITY_DN70100_c0_g1~~TRINITY_DN70100_c0_g1_i1.p2  ORF type:complete len:128 (+),score=1.35 TRINITY_DN70100_c0_g1_i1:104-487(+)
MSTQTVDPAPAEAVVLLRQQMLLDGLSSYANYPAPEQISLAAFGLTPPFVSQESAEFYSDMRHKRLFLPTVVAGVKALLEELESERALREKHPALAASRLPLDPVEWLAQWLMRNNPYVVDTQGAAS